MYAFVQSLIREVAYGTLARRDRRARHLAAARYFEAIGDDELAGALASHYVAAHEASDEGPEADAIAAQARLALRSGGRPGDHARRARTGDRLPRAGALDHDHRASAPRCWIAPRAAPPPRPAPRRPAMPRLHSTPTASSARWASR